MYGGATTLMVPCFELAARLRSDTAGISVALTPGRLRLIMFESGIGSPGGWCDHAASSVGFREI
jgi:hypothetical protein